MSYAHKQLPLLSKSRRYIWRLLLHLHLSMAHELRRYGSAGCSCCPCAPAPQNNPDLATGAGRNSADREKGVLPTGCHAGSRRRLFICATSHGPLIPFLHILMWPTGHATGPGGTRTRQCVFFWDQASDSSSDRAPRKAQTVRPKVRGLCAAC